MKDINQPLRGKVAIVTGAGRGIGAAIARAYAGAGAGVLCAARSVAELETTVHAIEAAGGRAVAVPVDVTNAEAVDLMVRVAVESFGGLDILVVNAGVAGQGRTVEESDPAAWRAALEVNLVGAYLCARAAIPALKARDGGKIVMVGSGLGHRGAATVSDYACSKAGMWMLTRVLAQELAPFGIDVNELIPGPVATPMTTAAVAQRQLQTPALAGEWFKNADDVVPLALFLATQPARGPSAQSFGLARREL